ncbi:class F sortase [Streptomyces lavendulocolor]|uniref:class F sortase n=1 Tax=Streptomyces lavendulocolor TaxID=67316 RepID=UPI003C2F071A
MSDTVRRLTGPVVAVAALAAFLAVRPAPPDPAPADFGTASPAAPASQPRTTGTPTGAPPRSDPPPSRVLVPDIGLDAPVRPVGVTGSGEVAVPADPDVAGWYRFGPAPGSDRGSAVLVGHVDDDTGALGEFAALYEVRPGDRVEVRRTGSPPADYRVVSRVTVPKDDLPASVFRRTDAPVLTLVTCAPPFDPERGGYLSNLVVTAEPLRG